MSKKIVICGGGIIGASAAYFLTQKGAAVTVIESCDSLGSSASGKAGGFLAGHWGNRITAKLHKAGFALYQNLAKELHLETYRKLPTLSCDGSFDGHKIAPWLDRKVSSSIMDQGTAQVTPKEITTKLMEAAIARGATLMLGVSVIGIQTESTNNSPIKKVKSVILSHPHPPLACDQILISMGIWSLLSTSWFDPPLYLPLSGIKSTSVILPKTVSRNSVLQNPFALFCAEDQRGCHLEVYPRPNGEIYICGLGSSEEISLDRVKKGGDCEKAEYLKGDINRATNALQSLKEMTSIADQAEEESEPVVQSCIRPYISDSYPVMGEIPQVDGGFICTGHNCWGILWGPISGLVMSELMMEGKAKTVDICDFSITRFQRKK